MTNTKNMTFSELVREMNRLQEERDRKEVKKPLKEKRNVKA